MKKPKPTVTDATRTVAARAWETWPSMKPVGEERQLKDLKALEAVLTVLPVIKLWSVITALRQDQYRRDWVASFERIAEELPRIRLALEPKATAKRDSFVNQWRKDQYDGDGDHY